MSAMATKRQPQQPERVKLTLYCYLVGVVGCMGGLSFGYEGPVISGLIINPYFLKIFEDSSTSSSTEALASQSSSYCKLSSPELQIYISCSFITAAVATAAAATWTDRFGRKNFTLAAAALILTANVLQTAATGKVMLFIGRLIMGLGQGFATFTVPMYVAEMAPAAVRGRLGTVYSIATTIGQLLAFAINQAVYAGGVEFGWRIVFAALAWCPLVMLLLLGAVLPDTPSSLLQRGRQEKARASFRKLRHVSSNSREEEWQGMCDEVQKIVSTAQKQQQNKNKKAFCSHGRTGLISSINIRNSTSMAGDRSCICDADAAASISDISATVEQGLAVTAAGVSKQHVTSTSSNDNSLPNASLQMDSSSIMQPQTAKSPADVAVPTPCVINSHSAVNNTIHVNKGQLAKSPAASTQGGPGSVWPALIIMLHLTVLRSFGGFVNIMYFTALLFSSTGNSTTNSLLAQTLMGVSTLIGGLAAMVGIDKIGRRPLLVWMAFAMAALMAAAAAILGAYLPPSAAAAGISLSPGATAALMVVLCFWQIAFWSSWGPCFYVVLSELYPLQSRARSVGWGMVTFNLGVTLVLSLGGSMLCAMTYGLLVFFAGVNLYLGVFAAACLPETRGRQLHDVGEVYRQHWLWKHAYPQKPCSGC